MALSTANGSSHGQDHLQSGSADEHMGFPSSADEEQNNLALTVVPDKSLVHGEISTSSLGDVKMSLSCTFYSRNLNSFYQVYIRK